MTRRIHRLASQIEQEAKLLGERAHALACQVDAGDDVTYGKEMVRGDAITLSLLVEEFLRRVRQ